MSFGGNQNTVTSAERISAIQLQSSTFGKPIPLAWGQPRIPANLIWYGDFVAIPHATSQSSGGKGGGSVTQTNITYTYQAAMALGLCEGPISAIPTVWADKVRTTLAALGLTIFNGTYPQTAWGYLTTNHPGQDIGYQGIAYAANATYQLNSSAGLPNHNFEVRARLPFGFVSGIAKTFTVAPVAFKTFTATAGSATLSAPSHGYAANQQVRLSTTGTLPAPFLANTDYYVTVIDANNISLRLNVSSWVFNNSTVTPTNVGSGSQRVFKTSDLVGSTVTSNAHGFPAGMVMQLTTTGTLPSGFALGTDYYVVAPTTNTFQLSATYGGAPVSATSAGTGTHTATPFIVDALASDILNDFLTNQNYGVLLPSARMGSLTSFANYCRARGLFMSPALLQQAPAVDFVKEVLELTNTGPVWSEGVLKLVPYGDQNLTGYGATYTANVTPLYNLTDDDFVVNGSEDPIKVVRVAPSDAPNQSIVAFSNRANQYNVETAEAKDQSNIELYGLRPAQPKRTEYINDPLVASSVAQTLLQKSLYVRNMYEFSVASARYALLEPMDLVTLTDPGLNLSLYAVRVLEVEDHGDTGLMTIRAEDFPLGVAHPAQYATQVSSGYSVDYNSAPGNANPPVMFNSPGVLAATGYEVWLAISGGANWGGCDVWVSQDGTQYKKAGTLNGPSRHGFLSSLLPTHTDPDTVDTLSVDLTVSRGSLTGGSQADADNNLLLCWVEDELMSFRDATLTALYKYNLGGSIRRGVYNSTIGPHQLDSRFVRLDQSIFKYAYDAALVGDTLQFKFVSFNLYGGGLQDISTLPAYSFTMNGSISYPDNVQNFSGAQNGNVVAFRWDLIDPYRNPNSAGYEIRYNPQSSPSAGWNDATYLTRVTRGSAITTAALPPGSWTCLIAARDNSTNYSKVPTPFAITIANNNIIIKAVPQAPDWLGTKVNFGVHWAGVLHPLSQSLASAGATGWEIFDQYVYNPFLACSYETAEIDLAIDGSVRLHGDIFSQLGPGQSGVSSPVQSLKYKLSAGAYNAYVPWGIGEVVCRYFQQKIDLDTTLAVAEITGFTPTADAVAREEVYSSLAVPATGYVITFATPFHVIPNVFLTLIAASGLTAGVTPLTTTSCTIHVYNSVSGVEVGGIVNATIRGV